VAEVGVFGAGVKNDAFGFGVEDIIVQGRLVLRAYVQGYGINIGVDGFGLFDGYAGNFAGFYAYVYNAVAAAYQSVSGEVGVSACVGRGTQYQCFFIGHDGITCKVGIWFFSSGGRLGFYRGLTEGN
jgi:hypothetical protein